MVAVNLIVPKHLDTTSHSLEDEKAPIDSCPICEHCKASNVKIKPLFIIDAKGSGKSRFCSSQGLNPDRFLKRFSHCPCDSHVFEFIYLGKNVGQHRAIYYGMRYILHREKETFKDRDVDNNITIVCDFDRFQHVLAELETILLTFRPEKVIIGIDKNKKRGLIRDVLSSMFYLILTNTLRSFFKVKKIQAEKVLRNLSYITTLSVFPTEYAKEILNYSDVFNIYIFSVFMSFLRGKQRDLDEKVIFYDLSGKLSYSYPSSYDLFKLLKFSVIAFTDLINFLRLLQNACRTEQKRTTKRNL